MIKQIRQYLRRGWKIRLSSSKANYNEILRRLDEHRPFSFSRWGDGEWEAVLNLKKQDEANCDGHQFFDSMRLELQNILFKKPSYMLGMQPLAYHKLMGRKIDSFFRSNNLKLEDLWWVNADVFHDASMSGKIFSFFERLKKKKVLLVGPQYLRNLKIFTFDHIEVPLLNCWLERVQIMAQIEERRKMKEYDVILFCAGMTSNWMVDQLHGNFKGFILDIGSLLDPFAGRNTRNYHKKLDDGYRGLDG